MKKLKLFFALFAMLALGVGNAWAETKIDEVSAIGFAGITTSGYTAAGTDYSAVANTTNNTSVTYAMQVFDGKTGAVRGNKSGNANFSCRNTTTCDGYYISKVVLTVTGGTLDGATNNRSVVYFGTSAYANPTTAPTGTSTKSAENATGTTLTWNNTNEEASYFILYNLKTSGTLKGGQVTITWTKKSGGPTPDPGTPVATLTADPTSLDFGTVTQNDDVAAKTFTISGSDLTAGELALTAPSGYTVSPATVAVDGTLANTTVTVTPNTTAVGSFNGNLTITGGGLTAAVNVALSMTVEKAPATPTGTMYVKVTDVVTDGEYLIVYEDAANNPQSPVAFNGALTTLDAVSNNIAVAISSNTIAGNTDIDAATFTIDATAKTVKSKSGYYIGQTSDANGLKANNSTKYENALSIENNGTATIKSGGAYLRYNSDANNWRFRYYKSSSYSGQKAIALYKKASSHTVTIASCENGSVSADVASGAKVLSGTTVTLENTPATGYKLSAYGVYKTGDNTTKVTVTDDKFIMPEFDVTISATFELAKTLTEIKITTPATQTTFWQGETFNSTGLKVTAHFDGAADEDVTDKVTVEGSTATAGEQTVTVSYNEGATTKTATYNITVKAIPNTKETAYSVAEAYDIIDKLTTAEGVFISGIISQVDSYNSTYKSITYWISADGTTTNQLQVYSGKGLESADFSGKTDLSVGDQVIVCGNLKKYSGTYEFDKNNYLASYTPTTKDPADLAYATTEYTANVGEAFTTPELTNPHNLVVTYSTSDASKATVDANTGAVTVVAAGVVTITAATTGDATHDAGSASYTITISNPAMAVATLPFTFNSGKADIENTAGMSQTGLETDYGSAPKLKFNGVGDNVIIHFDSQAGEFSFVLKQNGQNAGTFTVFESANGEDYTSVWAGGDFGNAQSETIKPTLSATARYVKFEYTTKGNSTNYALGSISIAKPDLRQEAGLAWNLTSVTLTQGEAFTAPTFSNPNSLTVSFESSNTALATVNNAGEISLVSGKTGTATITATYAGNEFYKAAAVTCVITVSPKSEKVVILAQYNGQWYALKAAYLSGKTDRLDAIHVNYVGGKLYNVAEADKASIEWSCVVEGDKVSFINDGKYLKGKTNTTLLFEEDADGLYQWDNTTYTMTIGTTERSFLYNGEAFRNFAVSNAGKVVNDVLYSSLPVVTAPVYKTGPLYTITATAENGTVIGAGIYEADAKVTLTADPAMDYTFVSWTKGGEVVSTTNPFVFKTTENLDLVANFQVIGQTTKALTGKFSVGEYEYAEFATGNLQHNPKSGDWRFAKQQYQYVGEANINVGDDSYEGWIDMLGWSTNDAGNNYGVNPNNVNDLYGGTFQDWGDLFSADENWSTLSADQWKYLLNMRTNASSLKQIARVGSVVGIMLFPDNWNAPLTVTAQHDSYFDVDIHNYTLDQWAALENAGALFLPAAGRRAGGYGNTINKDQEEETSPENLNGGHYKHYDNGNIYCYYWTSTINESTKDVSYLHNIQALGGDKYTIGTGAVWGEKGRYGQSVRLAKVTDIPVVIRKELTVGQLGTVCLPYNIPSGQVYGATFYTLEGKMDNKVVFDEVTGELAAGVPYLFQASAEEISCFPGTTIVTEPNNSGAMKGTFVNLELDGSDLTNIYYFAKNALWSCVDLTKLSVPANRAYVNMAEVTAITEAAPVGVRRITLGVNGQNTATGVDQVQGDNVPSKMIINGQLFILRGEKMYDAQGKLVK